MWLKKLSSKVEVWMAPCDWQALTVLPVEPLRYGVRAWVPVAPGVHAAQKPQPH